MYCFWGLRAKGRNKGSVNLRRKEIDHDATTKKRVLKMTTIDGEARVRMKSSRRLPLEPPISLPRVDGSILYAISLGRGKKGKLLSSADEGSASREGGRDEA